MNLTCKEAFFGGAAGGGKALALDTPIATPDGWTTMGGIRTGDQVFGIDGVPTYVVACSRVMFNRICYKVNFSDGSSIVADAEHRWQITTRNDRTQNRRVDQREVLLASRRANRKSRAGTGVRLRPDLALKNRLKEYPVPDKVGPKIVTTEDLYLGCGGNAVRVAQPLELPEADLPIPPYVLGCWLGDGSSASGGITIHPKDNQILDNIRSLGFPVSIQDKSELGHTITGLRGKLASLGVLGNKHIPQQYLRASAGQRLELLQGLIDTDGYVRGQVELGFCNKQLAHAALELVHSLGIKATLYQRDAKLYGRVVNQGYGFKFVTHLPVAKLDRKLNNQKREGFRGTHNQRYITSVEPVESVPVKCIQVAAADGMFLAGKEMIPTHNSDCLLRAALQYVHIPKYSALILRTSMTDLALPGGLIPKSHQWLAGKAHWNGNVSRWTFPSGATLQFGYLSNVTDKYRYRSSEFQYIAFDELTDFSEEDYLFMFSRVRQTIDINVPERIRAASNPGGKGHEWVKNRFIPKEMQQDLVNDTMQDVYFIDSNVEDEPPLASVPSKIRDNPAIDPKKYVKNLMHLGPVMRERMMAGDWTVMPTGLIKPEWLRYFTMRDRMVDLLVSRLDAQGNIMHLNEVAYEYHEAEARRFMTIDTAGGMQQLVDEKKGKPSSWTVMGVWDHKRYGDNDALLLRHVWRGKAGFTEVAEQLILLNAQWKPYRIRVEDQTMGPSLQNLLRGKMPIDLISTEGKDKVTRAVPLMNMMAQGQLYLPRGENSWRPQWEAEILSWQGLKEETNDQIDMSAYAAIEATGGIMGGVIPLDMDPRERTVVGDSSHWSVGAVRW